MIVRGIMSQDGSFGDNLRQQSGAGKINDMYLQYLQKPIFPNSRTGFSGETHAPGYNFLGPGTWLRTRLERGDQPVNTSDACAMNHDMDYRQIKGAHQAGVLTKAELAEAVRAADETFVECLRNKTSDDLLDKLTGYASEQIFAGKKLLEDVNLMDPTRFVLGKHEVAPGIIADSPEAVKYLEEQQGGSTDECCPSCTKYNVCENLPAYKLKMRILHPEVELE